MSISISMMGSFLRSTAVVILAFAASSNAHLKLMRPVPYGIKTLNKSPLINVAPGAPTSDYPCKLRTGVYDLVVMNNFTVGQPQELSFIGSVSHGGGTCQLTMTKDKEPTANSTFKVFQVFEGGCPIDSNGNTGTHPFTFVLPKGMPNGIMTFAWIWYNRIGDREIYMNCCPANVSGGSDNDNYFNSLPNAYVINLPTEGANGCQSTFEDDSNAVTIPHPGQFILKEAQGQEMHVATGSGCAAAAARQLNGVVGYNSTIIQDNGAAYTGISGKLPPVPVASSGAAASAVTTSAPGRSPPSSDDWGAAGAGSANAALTSATPGVPRSKPPSPFATSFPNGSAAASAPPETGAASSFSSLTPTGNAGVTPPNGVLPTGKGGSHSEGSAIASRSGATGLPVGSATASQSGSACSDTNNSISCSSDGGAFGVCSGGKFVWRAVAPGTTCKGGQIARKDRLRRARARRQLHRRYFVEVLR